MSRGRGQDTRYRPYSRHQLRLMRLELQAAYNTFRSSLLASSELAREHASELASAHYEQIMQMVDRGTHDLSNFYKR